MAETLGIRISDISFVSAGRFELLEFETEKGNFCGLANFGSVNFNKVQLRDIFYPYCLDKDKKIGSYFGKNIKVFSPVAYSTRGQLRQTYSDDLVFSGEVVENKYSKVKKCLVDLGNGTGNSLQNMMLENLDKNMPLIIGQGRISSQYRDVTNKGVRKLMKRIPFDYLKGIIKEDVSLEVGDAYAGHFIKKCGSIHEVEGLSGLFSRLSEVGGDF